MESKYRPEPYFLSTSSLSSLNLTGQVARFAAFFGEVLIATVPARVKMVVRAQER